ncbi:MAG: hypothetical protein BWY89_00297 [Bacteroidetes bacterium ADurb.BinA012]|nr:MAG: hypothetical protein BWY89_00297 [Bacteroidetes bacterium ADurb.BinA012]
MNCAPQSQVGLNHAADHELEVGAACYGSYIKRLYNARLHKLDVDGICTTRTYNVDGIGTGED